MSAPPPATLSSSGRWLATLGWAVYLGVSWTWCIGMFLPLLLMRDFGLAGYLAFAIPNVAGAAAMGWMIRSPEASRGFVERHRAACAAFSVITALFHVAFLFEVILPLDAMRGGLPAVLAVVLGSIALSRFDRPRLIALATYLVSVGVIVTLARGPGLPLGSMEASALGAAGAMRLPVTDVLFLVPACVFGFLLCPYLDLTFHRARQDLPGVWSRWGFGLGFGVLFLAMILFTPMYASLFEPHWVGPGVRPAALVAGAVLVHLAAQSAATISFHMRALLGTGHRGAWWAVAALLLGVVAYTFLPRAGAPTPPALSDSDERLIWYRVFMSFYGLVFPAYVWLVAIPTADGHSGTSGRRGQRKLVVLLVSCALAAPCFWVGFIERQTWWLGPGMAIVLFARMLVRSRPTEPSEAIASR